MPDPKNRLPERNAQDDPTPATEAPETMPPRPEPDSPRTQRPDVPANTAPASTGPDEDAPELTIDTSTVAWIILKARELDMKEPASVETDDDDGSNPLGVLEDRADDSTQAELRNWIMDLDDDSQAELVALMWLGRGDDEDMGTFPGLVEEARGRQQHGRRTVGYLLGTPRLGDYLEEGLEKLGVDTANLEGSLR